MGGGREPRGRLREDLHGISTHDRAELARALALDPAYVALGPIYPTLRGKMPWRAQGLDRLARWKRSIPWRG